MLHDAAAGAVDVVRGGQRRVGRISVQVLVFAAGRRDGAVGGAATASRAVLMGKYRNY